MKKVFRFLILVLLVIPFISVSAMADTTFIVNSLSDALKDANGSVTYEGNQIEISWPVWLKTNESIYEISYDGNIIEYDPKIPTNYDETSNVLNLEFMILGDIIPGVLKKNGYTDTEIREFLYGEYVPTFEVNGIEFIEKSEELEFNSDDGSLKMTPLKIKIDVTKANINKTGEPEIKTTTIEDVVNALNEDESFTEYKYEGVLYSTKSIDMDEDNKKLIITYNENQYDWKYVYLNCEDDIISYEADEIADYDEASSVASHLMFTEMIKNIALKENGYTMQEILEFENNNKYSYYINRIQIENLGESKKYTSEDETSSVTVAPTSIKIDLSKANLKTKDDLKNYTINSNTDSGDSISFDALEGEIYSFYIKDRKNITDEELQQIAEMIDDPEYTFENLKEQLNIFIECANKAAGNGTLLKLYEIYLTNNGIDIHEVDGGFKIKIKITDDMKGYDSYKLVYISDDGTPEDAIELTKNGEYLEGTLPHLSMYALIGNVSGKTTVTTNPQTGDIVIMYIPVLGLSIIGLSVTRIYSRKIN